MLSVFSVVFLLSRTYVAFIVTRSELVDPASYSDVHLLFARRNGRARDEGNAKGRESLLSPSHGLSCFALVIHKKCEAPEEKAGTQ